MDGIMRIQYCPDQYSQQRQRQKKAWVYPVLLAMEAEWYRQNGYDVSWNEPRTDWFCKTIKYPENIDFLSLPAPDRIFTNAKDKKYQKYGNYKYHPATHMQVADGCWHGACSFCVENGKKYKIRSLHDVVKEISICTIQGFREIFDDSGTFPTGKWLKDFCDVYSGNTYIRFGCNMRIDADVDYVAMKKAGFRMLLFGVESANQYTLDRINKGVKVNEITKTIRNAAAAGLEPHIAVMFGYPWETAGEERETLNLVHNLLRKGFAKTAQASLYDVKDGCSIDRKNVNRIYSVAKYPDFWINKAKDIRTWEDFVYLIKGIRKGILRD
jgi:radical SAM superfamily enzyme YgiQ (UPF0313 family)